MASVMRLSAMNLSLEVWACGETNEEDMHIFNERNLLIENAEKIFQTGWFHYW